MGQRSGMSAERWAQSASSSAIAAALGATGKGRRGSRTPEVGGPSSFPSSRRPSGTVDTSTGSGDVRFRVRFLSAFLFLRCPMFIR
jgi:hypothetical protein